MWKFERKWPRHTPSARQQQASYLLHSSWQRKEFFSFSLQIYLRHNRLGRDDKTTDEALLLVYTHSVGVYIMSAVKGLDSSARGSNGTCLTHAACHGSLAVDRPPQRYADVRLPRITQDVAYRSTHSLKPWYTSSAPSRCCEFDNRWGSKIWWPVMNLWSKPTQIQNRNHRRKNMIFLTLREI
jgi:hypothetical protein